IAAIAHKGFDQIQAEMKPIAAQIAKQRKLPSSDYREVTRIEKRATGRRCDSASVPGPPEADRRHYPQTEYRQLARSHGTHPHCHGGGNRAATGAPHGAAALSAQHRTKG